MGNYETDGVHLIPVHIDAEIISGIPVQNTNVLPEKFQLYQNYPNPFNPATRINYVIAAQGIAPVQVELTVFNILGQKVRTLVNGRQKASSHCFVWDGRNDNGLALGSGIYLYRLTVPGFSKTKKMLLIR